MNKESCSRFQWSGENWDVANKISTRMARIRHRFIWIKFKKIRVNPCLIHFHPCANFI